MRKFLLPLVLVAMALEAVPARADPGPGEFVVRCRYSHSLMDDPIVFPGQPGASHLHDFFGNRSTDADSTVESLLAASTTCRVPSDTAGYWSPTAYLLGNPVTPRLMRVYYLGSGSAIETIPPGLKMIGGNKLATSPADNPHVRWYCGQSFAVGTPVRDAPYDCTPYARYRFVDGVVGVVDLPSCWDGTGLEPEDVDYPVGGTCPSPFSHALPRVSERIHFGVMDPLAPDGSVALSLSSGPFYTLHADFWNTWHQDRLDQLVADCLQAGIHCGAVGAAPTLTWTGEFGTPLDDEVTGVATRPGRVFAVGWTSSALPGQPSHYPPDAFLRASDGTGAERWTRQFGTSGADQALAVAASGTGEYVVGSTDGVLPGQRDHGGTDAFVTMYDRRGDELWAREFGGAFDDEATAVAVDATGVYVAGVTDTGAPERGVDGFLRRYTFDGRPVWTRRFGTSLEDRVDAVALDDRGVYVGGSTGGSLVLPNAGGLDAFVRAYRRDGSAWWDEQFGTTGDDEVHAIGARRSGVYVAGSTTGTLKGLTGYAGTDGFLIRLSHRPEVIWARQFGTFGDDEVQGLGINADGIFVAGATTGAFPDLVSLGGSDAFLVKYNTRGAQLWSTQFGTVDEDTGRALAVNKASVYVGGSTNAAFEGQANAGGLDAFVAKIAFS